MNLDAADVLVVSTAKWSAVYADALNEIARLTVYAKLLEQQLADQSKTE